MADTVSSSSDVSVNPFLPDKWAGLGMMLSGLGAGISAAAARNQPAWLGIAPGAELASRSYYGNLSRAMNYDLALKNYQLQNSYKRMQEQQIGLQSEMLRRQFGFQDSFMRAHPELFGGGGATPGIQPPAPPLMGPQLPGTAQTAQDETGGSAHPYTQDNLVGSGAYGKYQFMPETWAGVASAHPELGLPFNMKQSTPEQQEAAKTALDQDNAQGLRTVGIQPSDATLYIAHRFGVQGARTFLGAPDDAQIASIFPAQWIAKNPDLRGVTVGQFKQSVGQRYGGAPQGGQGTPGLPRPPGPPPNLASYAMGALGGPAFGQMTGALGTNLQKQYEYEWKRYNDDLARYKLRYEQAQGAVSIDPTTGQPTPNRTVIDAAAQKAAAEERAKAQAHTDYLFPEGFDKLSTDQKLAKLPANVRGVVEDLGPKGDLALSDLPTRMASAGLDPSKVDIYSLARRVWGDQFDMRQREAQKNFMTNIYSAGKPEGATRLALITGIQHLSTFASLVKAQNNGDYPTMNAIVKAWNEQKGNPRFSGADALMQFLAPEAAKVVKGGNQINEKEVEDNKEQLLNTKSWPQANTILQTWMGAMLARKNGLEDTARSLGVPEGKIDRFWGTGSAGPDGKPLPAAMTKALQEFYDTTAGEQVHGPAPTPAAPSQQTQAPAQGAPTAVNPKTGQRMILRNGKWEPL